MGYALFANRKIVVTSELNYASLMQTQRSNEQYKLATQTLSLQQKLTSLQANQSLELSKLYDEMAELDPDDDNYAAARQKINDKINAKEKEHDVEIDKINRQIYVVSVKEKSVELLVKRLDTQVTSLQKQLEAIEQAEGGAIDRATPKFKGVG